MANQPFNIDDRRTWPTPITDEPTMDQLESWMFDSEYPEATCGCICDPDGWCSEHNHPSWLLVLSLI